MIGRVLIESFGRGLAAAYITDYLRYNGTTIANFRHLTRPVNGMKSQGIADFRAPPPIPKFIDTTEAFDELPSYDSFDPAPDDF
jgi:hypothetical protein